MWPKEEGIRLHYNLKMYNSSCHEWRKWSFPARDNTTRTDAGITLRYFETTPGASTLEISLLYAPQRCDEVVFYLNVVNSIGKSNFWGLRNPFQIGKVLYA